MESTDPAAISHLLAEAQDLLISKDAVVLPLFYKTRSMLRNAVAQGLRESPVEMWEERQDFARE
jgi:ABC-type oligopeptide transport system substrate-binding subunit